MAEKRLVCTILAKNYISFARTLMRSVQASNPEIECCALIIDDWKEFIQPDKEPFEVISLHDIAIEGQESMTFKYDITEFSTAVKPFLLTYLLKQKGADKVLYLDPDILVTYSLDSLYEVLDESDFVVTPHLDADYPEDGLQPDERHILLAGLYNLGFFGIRKNRTAFSFLEWWQNKLKTRCVISPSKGYFVDQRFIDLATTIFPTFYIERSTGYNVAYWNLHSRALSHVTGSWNCNGEQLYFFHFSGFNPEKPEVLSKYNTRVRLQDRIDLRGIFEDYRQALFRNGYRDTISWPYSYAKFEDGAPVTYFARVRYRAALSQGAGVTNPFQLARGQRKALTKEGRIRNSRLYTAIANLAHQILPPFLWSIRSRFRAAFGGVKFDDAKGFTDEESDLENAVQRY